MPEVIRTETIENTIRFKQSLNCPNVSTPGSFDVILCIPEDGSKMKYGVKIYRDKTSRPYWYVKTECPNWRDEKKSEVMDINTAKSIARVWVWNALYAKCEECGKPDAVWYDSSPASNFGEYLCLACYENGGVNPDQ